MNKIILSISPKYADELKNSAKAFAESALAALEEMVKAGDILFKRKKIGMLEKMMTQTSLISTAKDCSENIETSIKMFQYAIELYGELEKSFIVDFSEKEKNNLKILNLKFDNALEDCHKLHQELEVKEKADKTEAKSSSKVAQGSETVQ